MRGTPSPRAGASYAVGTYGPYNTNPPSRIPVTSPTRSAREPPQPAGDGFRDHGEGFRFGDVRRLRHGEAVITVRHLDQLRGLRQRRELPGAAEGVPAA